MNRPSSTIGTLQEDFTVTGHDPVPTLPKDRNGAYVLMRPEVVRLHSAVNEFDGLWEVYAARVYGPKINAQGKTTTHKGEMVRRTHLFHHPADPDLSDKILVPDWLTTLAVAHTPTTGTEAAELRAQLAELTARLAGDALPVRGFVCGGAPGA